MIEFKLKERDKTGARLGYIKSENGTFNSHERACVSTELNYTKELNGVAENIKYPHKLFFAQLRMDIRRFLKKDNSYFSSLKRQVMKHLPLVTDKSSILKVVLGVNVWEKQKDGKNKKRFKTLDKTSIKLEDDEIKIIIKNVMQLVDESGDYEGVTLPYTSPIFKLNIFNKNLRFAEKYVEEEFGNEFKVIPEIPHTDNINDFEKVFSDYYDNHKEGWISVPYRNRGKYIYTHNAVREFSKNDKSEKIGIICTNAPRKFKHRLVSYPHYALLEGYDVVVRKIYTVPFLRQGGKGAHDLKIDRIKQFIRKKLSVEPFDKGLLYNENKVDRLNYPFIKDFTYKELFRLATENKVLDTLLKVMESFDSYKEVQSGKPYISSGDFREYVKQKESLNLAYLGDFCNILRVISISVPRLRIRLYVCINFIV